MSTRDMLRFIFETSQVDADTEASLREAEQTERLKMHRTPLVKALGTLGIDGKDVQIDDLGARLVLPDAEAWHTAVKALGTVEAMNSLAENGWVCEIAGDVADTTEPSQFTINFLCLHDVEASEQDKASTAAQLNKAAEGGSDTVIPKEQAARDKERSKTESLSEADLLLQNPGEPQAEPEAENPLTAQRRAVIFQTAAQLASTEDVMRFFQALVDAGINFHPDTSFEDYTDGAGERVFTDDEAARLNKAMERTFDIADPYVTGLEVMKKADGFEPSDEPGLADDARRVVDDALNDDDDDAE